MMGMLRGGLLHEGRRAGPRAPGETVARATVPAPMVGIATAVTISVPIWLAIGLLVRLVLRMAGW